MNYNTEDEFTHFTFINAFLVSKGVRPVNLDRFRTLMGSQAKGAADPKTTKRLTNLMELKVDTSWWTRYRSRDFNPDLDPGHIFPQAVPDLIRKGPFPAIPRTDADLTPANHSQAIANTAAFHFASIEQGGTSLYPTLALRVTNRVVLRILLSIGPTETMHFQTWQDKAGNAVSVPLAPLTDGSLTFPNLNVSPGGEDFQTNLIMPRAVPVPPQDVPAMFDHPPDLEFRRGEGVTGLTASGLFNGQSRAFFKFVGELAEEADEATRRCDED